MKGLLMKTWELSFILVFGLAAFAIGGNYPEKPIKIIINYAPGGGHDVIARSLQGPLAKALGTSIIVENVPGGSTKIGTMQVLKAKPDGYTIVLQADDGWVGYYYSKTYDEKIWVKLTPIANVVDMPSGFIEVRADGPYKIWQDLVNEAKKRPGEVTGAGPAAGGMKELIFHMVMDGAGVKCKYVPFSGAGPAQTAMLGGHVDFRVCAASEAMTMIKAGKTKGLAISTGTRYHACPDVPTFKELGVGEEVWSTLSIWGPPGMPQDIINTLTNGIKTALQDAKFVDLQENQLYNKIHFKTGPEVLKNTQEFDRIWGPKLASQYK
jgi:tripartite-type tricarboxylate transporter receptor subunit TctC